ncbi:MFS transporter [Myroides odoratimimus]|uniref:MDR family MFS transporter n=1 Tax=Myroides odoratimimus TaxID=76832 RepID=UPI00217F544C|nr:MFS transporter [Myroides odoratimimus]MCS7473274.1 MFS transporter [Myroides odoratimimus]MDM1058660.1 MFS transporter [Myroides odoratimimus]MDM1095984.1 MFS transporter [Myroides odoratimimus]MDM1413911.1 MFS transporter [Myroides odoratimimus]MDM1446159.1 MFS transporter [Myroides odoratimimus]
MKKIAQIYIDSYKGLSSASWMLAIVMLINRSGSMVLPFLGVYMTKELHFSQEQTGYVLACFGVGSIIGTTVGGWVTDKIGNYKVQYLSLIGSIPVFIMLPHFTSVVSLALMMLLQSAVSEMFRPANSVAITMYAKPENITRAFSLNRMAVNLGFSIGPAMGGILAAISYALLFYVNATAAFLAAVVFIYFFRNRKTNKELLLEQEDITELNEIEDVSNKSPYKDKMFLIYSVFCTLYSIAFLQLLSTLPIFYEKTVGLDEVEIGLILGYSGLLIFLTEMLLVHVAEKFFTIRQTIFYGVMISALGYGMLAFDHSYISIYISMTILCVSEMLAMPFTSTVTAMRAGSKNKGAYMGVNGLTFAIGFIISPILGTKVASTLGYDVLWLGTAALVIIAALGLNYSVKKMAEE